MTGFKLLLALAIGILTTAIFAPARAAEPPGEFDIRGADGKLLIAADKIRSYDWSTHTLSLQPGTRPALANSLAFSRELVSGVPFTVCVGGKPVYEGILTTPLSSRSFAKPVIVVPPIAYNTAMLNDDVRIQLGYPTQEFFKGEDPRADNRIEAALRAAGKLANTRDDRIQWVAASLLEMQTIKPGMTREDLLKVFVEEGGLSTRFDERYAYRDCPYIKVDAKFNPAASPDDKRTKHPRDKIAQISTPFLEWPIAD